MAIVKFEDLIAWQKAQDLAVDGYAIFKELKDWGISGSGLQGSGFNQ